MRLMEGAARSRRRTTIGNQACTWVPREVSGGHSMILRNPPETFRSGIPNERLRTEYTAWAGTLAERGLFLEGEELGDDGRLLHPNPESDVAVSVEELAATDKTVSGYFLIRARNYKEAEAIARTCPHIGYGGAIEVRPLQDQ